MKKVSSETAFFALWGALFAIALVFSAEFYAPGLATAFVESTYTGVSAVVPKQLVAGVLSAENASRGASNAKSTPSDPKGNASNSNKASSNTNSSAASKASSQASKSSSSGLTNSTGNASSGSNNKPSIAPVSQPSQKVNPATGGSAPMTGTAANPGKAADDRIGPTSGYTEARTSTGGIGSDPAASAPTANPVVNTTQSSGGSSGFTIPLVPLLMNVAPALIDAADKAIDYITRSNDVYAVPAEPTPVPIKNAGQLTNGSEARRLYTTDIIQGYLDAQRDLNTDLDDDLIAGPYVPMPKARPETSVAADRINAALGVINASGDVKVGSLADYTSGSPLVNANTPQTTVTARLPNPRPDTSSAAANRISAALPASYTTARTAEADALRAQQNSAIFGSSPTVTGTDHTMDVMFVNVAEPNKPEQYLVATLRGGNTSVNTLPTPQASSPVPSAYYTNTNLTGAATYVVSATKNTVPVVNAPNQQAYADYRTDITFTLTEKSAGAAVNPQAVKLAMNGGFSEASQAVATANISTGIFDAASIAKLKAELKANPDPTVSAVASAAAGNLIPGMTRGEGLAAINDAQITANESVDRANQVAANQGKVISSLTINLNANTNPSRVVSDTNEYLNQVSTRSPSLPAASAKSVEGYVTPATAAKYIAATAAGKVDSHLERYSSANDIAEVKAVQTYLKGIDLYTGNVDGDFGPLTEQAVKSYQASKGIDTVGKVGPQTRAALANDAAAVEEAMLIELQGKLGVPRSGKLDERTRTALDAAIVQSSSGGTVTTQTGSATPTPASSSGGYTPRPVGFINASSPAVSPGGSVNLRWTGINAKTVRITDSATQTTTTYPVSLGGITVSPQITTIYTAVFIGDGGQSNAATSVRVQ